jgi:hypothetical protein
VQMDHDKLPMHMRCQPLAICRKVGRVHGRWTGLDQLCTPCASACKRCRAGCCTGFGVALTFQSLSNV